jgi:hypothetical protein
VSHQHRPRRESAGQAVVEGSGTAQGWTGSIRWFSENVKELRVEHRPIDPSDRLSWAAGDAAQCDLWFPPRKIPLEDGSAKLLPVLVITAAHSRFITGRSQPYVIRGSVRPCVMPCLPRRPALAGTAYRIAITPHNLVVAVRRGAA